MSMYNEEFGNNNKQKVLDMFGGGSKVLNSGYVGCQN